MMRTPAALSLVLLTSLVVAGCASRAPPTITAGEPPPQYVQTAGMTTRGVGMLILNSSVPGSLVRLDVLTDIRPFGGCQDGAGVGETSGLDFVGLKIFNRRGVAGYVEAALNWSRTPPAVLAAPLAGDAPFAAWAISTCALKVHLVFNGTGFSRTSHFEASHDKADGLPPVADLANAQVTVKVPAGQTRGVGSFSILGNSYFFHDGIAAGSIEVKSGVAQGRISTYEPGVWEAGGHWMKKTTVSPTGQDWDLYKGEMGAPGEWKVVVDLDAPAATESVWVAHYRQYVFTETITTLGFDYPRE